MAKLRMLTLVFLLTLGVTVFFLPDQARAASCDAFVTKWAWFIGGEVTVNPDGTFVQQSGNAGTWECTDPARGRITMRWRDGGFVNSLLISPDGQSISSTDLSQSYVTARRSGPAPRTPVVRQENCCQEAFGCETKKIEAEFAQKMARCHFPGNSGCIAEATSTKASRLKAANEKLRSCNRAANSSLVSAAPATGGATSLPTSNDEFHSTEGTGGFAQECQPCGLGTDQPKSNDEFHSSDGAECCPTQECQTQRYHALEFLRQQSAKRCVENKTSPCKVEPELIIPPLCEIPKDGDQIGGVGDNFGSSDCPPDYVNNDIPGASSEMRYQLGFSQAVRRCLTDQVTIQNVAIAAGALKFELIAKLLLVAATPGAIDAVLHPPGVSLDPDPYLRGRAEGKNLCDWGLKVSPVLVARCGAKGSPTAVPQPQRPPQQTLAQLLKDLSWLKKINPTGNRKNCGIDVVATEQVLAGHGVVPVPEMSCGTFPIQLERFFGAEFGPIRPAAEINNTIFHAGEGARGIVSADGPGGGHYFNIVRFAGEVLLLDGQLGRLVSWAEYRQMGLTNFQLLRTN